MSASALQNPTWTFSKHRWSDLRDFLFKTFRLKCFPESCSLLTDNAVCGILGTYKRSPVEFSERDGSKWLLQTVQLRRRVSKPVTIGSKTAVMDVIGFIYVPLGSSTVQLHDSLGSRYACSCSEAGFSSRTATVLEGYTTEEQSSAVFFCWKGLNAKDIHIEIFPLYGGECLSPKAVHNGVEKFSEGRSKVADDVRPVAEVAQMTVKIHLCCGFRRTGKAIGQVYLCRWRICREIKVFCSLEYHMFYVLYHFVTYLLILPLTSKAPLTYP
jgi:hypothetical protein